MSDLTQAQSNPNENLAEWLAKTLEDRRLSRGERQTLRERAGSIRSDGERAVLRDQAFDFARQALASVDDRAVIDWLEDVLKSVIQTDSAETSQSVAEAYFSPGEDCHRAIGTRLARARSSAEICVFTITDDRLADELISAHRRGVRVRIVTDDAKAEDLGSDVERFEREGIPTRVDRSPFHMHHKFAILDESTLLTGSYNWTRGAARDNEENLVVTNDPRFVAPFQVTFARLWDKLN